MLQSLIDILRQEVSMGHLLLRQTSMDFIVATTPSPVFPIGTVKAFTSAQ